MYPVSMSVLCALLRRLGVWLACLLPLAARAAPVEFNLAAQPAHTALLAFSKQTQIDVLFSFDELRKVQSQAVRGRFEPEAALALLLEGTGFAAQPIGKGKFVVRAHQPPRGAIRGRLLRPDGAPARRVSVAALGTRQAATTDSDGDFTLTDLPPATYQLVATHEGYQPLHIKSAVVQAERTLELGRFTMEKAEDPSQMAPFVVEATADRYTAFQRERAPHGPRSAIGNLDLARTENSALPYTIYDRNQISRSGVVNLNDFLQRELLDADTGTRPPEQDGTQPVYVAGSSNLRLRGYSADETVILVNGRRLPEVLTSGDPAMPPDVNFIPLNLVQQVEVLPVSASALYTGNPVGGVINIVLRPGADVNATEISTTYTNTTRGFDAPQTSASLMHTRTLLDGALRIRLNASFTQSKPATDAELGYHQGRAPPPTSLEAAIYRATPNVRSLNLSPLFGPGTAPVTSVAPGANGNGGRAAFAGREGMPNLDFFKSPGGYAASLDSSDYPYGRQQQREVFFGSATYDVLPWLQLGFEGASGTTIINRGYDVFTADLRLAANNPLNPFRRPIAVSLNETAPLLGQGYSEARLEFTSLAFGAIAKLPWHWRVALDLQYARNLSNFRGLATDAGAYPRGADLGRWQQLVDEGRYNPLRDTQRFGPPADFYDRVLVYRGGRGQFVTLGDYDTWDAAVRATNDALRLPTGLTTVNVGVDYRRNHLARFHDEQRYGDGTPAAPPTDWAGRTLRRYSAFGEVQLPIFPARRLPSWLHLAEADVAVRYVASDKAKESNVAPTYGLKLDFANGLSFRGSLTTSSRFPTPSMNRQIFTPAVGGGSGGSYVTASISDPLRPGPNYNVQAVEVVTPDLLPEEALTQTAGLMFRRGSLHRFRATLDFVDTRKVNELVPLDAGKIVYNESLWPERVVRANRAPGDFHRVGPITTVYTGTMNLAWRHSQNWNSSLSYTWTEAFGGMLEVYGRLIYFQRYQRQALPTSPVVDEINHPETAEILKYRSSFGVNWSNRHWGIGLDGRYFHSRILPLQDWWNQRSGRIEPYWQYDAYAQAELGRWLPKRFFGGTLRAQLRVNNVLAAPFPAYANESSGSGVQPYGDWRGRVYSLSLTAAF